MPISCTTSQNNELFWEGSHCLKSLVIWDSRFEPQIAIAVKSRDLEHLVYVSIYIYMPLTPLGGPFLGVKMSRSRGSEEKTTMAERKAKIWKKKKKHWNMKTPPPFWWGCFHVAIFDYETGDFLRFLTNICPPSGVRAIYVCMYIYICVCGPHPFFCPKKDQKMHWDCRNKRFWAKKKDRILSIFWGVMMSTLNIRYRQNPCSEPFLIEKCSKHVFC